MTSLASRGREWLSVRLGVEGRRMAGNAGWLLADRATRMLLGLTVGAWVARHLGPGQYGQLAFAIAFVAMAQAVATLSADAIVVRDLVRDRVRSPEILGAIFWLRLAVGSLALAVVTLVAYVVDDFSIDSAVLTLVVGGALIFQAADAIDLWFQSQEQNRRTVVAKLVAYVTASALKVVLILADAPLFAFAVALLADAALAAAGLWIAYRRYPAPGRWRLQLSLARSTLVEAAPYMASGFATILYMRIDQVMVQNWAGDADLGLYSAALALSTFWGFLPLVLNIVLAPHVARKKHEGEEGYYATLAGIFRAYAALGLVAAGVTALAGPPAVRLLFGAEYAEAGQLLIVHGFTNVFIYLGVAQGLWLVNERKGALQLSKSLIGLVTCVACNLLLVPRYGALGAAVSAIVVQAVASFVANAWLARDVFLLQARALLLVLPAPARRAKHGGGTRG